MKPTRRFLMGQLFSLISVLAFAPIHAKALYTLASGPYELEDLGSPLSSNTQEQQIMYRTHTGELHLVMYYDLDENWKYPLQILDANLNTGAYQLVDGVLGRPGPGATVLHANGKIYLGSSDPGYLMSFDAAYGKVVNIGELSDLGAQHIRIGDDGAIYVGECCEGKIQRFDPAFGILEDFGRADPTSTSTYQYGYTIGADVRYVYTGLGQDPWYLGIYDRQTGKKTTYWRADEDSGGAVYHGESGGWYYRRINDGQGWYSKWYKLENGMPIEITPDQVPALEKWYQRGPNLVMDMSHFPSFFGFEINIDQAYPDSGNGNKAIVKWKPTSATEWRTVTATGFRINPTYLKRLYPWKDNLMFGFADFYGPAFIYNSTSNTLETLGRPKYSLYDALFNGDDIYLSGYPAVTLRYNSNNPWMVSDSALTKEDWRGSNPYKIPLSMGKYHYYSVKGADGLIYVAAHHERDSKGGELGWYNPADTTIGKLREPFLSDDTRDLKSALGGTKLIYASTPGRLFVFDVASKQIKNIFTPLLGVESDKVVETAPGVMFGATGSNIYSIDITKGRVLYAKTLPGQAFGGPSTIPIYDHRLTLGPDGYVWMFVDNALYRINPANGSLFKIIDTPATTPIFKGTDLYFYGGANIKRIKSIVTPSAQSGNHAHP